MSGEARAYQSFREHVRRPGDRLDRIENLLGLGFPDTNGCFSGTEFWLEIKAPIEPKRDSTPLFGSNHKLSQDQKNFFLTQRRADGIGFIYIETDLRRMLIDGAYADRVNLATASELAAIATWTMPVRFVACAGTPEENWARLRHQIINARFLRSLRTAEAIS